MSKSKKKIAVFIGGRSPEHDVSVVTGLQILSAIDTTRYEAFPVYIAPDGEWLIGDILRERSSYMLDANARKQTRAVLLDLKADRGGRLIPKKSGLLGGGAKPVEFDVAVPAFHGLYGEDGGIQGLFELANVPYTGMRSMGSAVLMDKGATKKLLQSVGIPVLPYALLKRPEEGYMLPREQLEALAGPIGFPCIVKPVHLGSSIGVARAEGLEELEACLPAVFEYDDSAIIEPFVQNMVEYNVAVSKALGGGQVRTSAIEKPKAVEALLDFKQKYLSGGDNKTGDKMGGGGTKNPGAISEGMLSLTRELNPKLPAEMEVNIRGWALAMFEALDGAGAPRIDFISNQKTGEIWMNEVNPIPGSFGYFLWEAAQEPVLFTDFLSALIEEALAENRARILPKDPVPRDARLLRRPV
ncbi:MAG: D-alanine--D-alanine ligase [Alphaproteobacteria bacterium]|nr:D-alanine--D-alanine ligase [Alphaproteobacteria bacterium]